LIGTVLREAQVTTPLSVVIPQSFHMALHKESTANSSYNRIVNI